MMKRFLLAAVSAGLVATTPGALAADPGKAKTIATTVCGACHGADGNSSISVNPKLAGQQADYIYKQLKNFKGAEGKAPERLNPIMNGMAAGLSDDDMKNLAAYYNAQKRKPEVAKNSETIEYAQKLYRAGDAAKGLPACAACHGPSGAGMPAQFPLIAGQFAEYTEAQLRSFRAGERANDTNNMMRLVTIKMTDPEIKAVSDYIAGLR